MVSVSHVLNSREKRAIENVYLINVIDKKFSKLTEHASPVKLSKLLTRTKETVFTPNADRMKSLLKTANANLVLIITLQGIHKQCAKFLNVKKPRY